MKVVLSILHYNKSFPIYIILYYIVLYYVMSYYIIVFITTIYNICSILLSVFNFNRHIIYGCMLVIKLTRIPPQRMYFSLNKLPSTVRILAALRVKLKKG